MRIWAFPSFYPYDYPGMRWTGTFAHRQYQGLISNGAELNVIVPVKWNPPFPFSEFDQEWKKNQKLNYPKKRIHEGVTVYHPRIANMKPNRFVKKTYTERYVDAIIKFFKDFKIELDPKKDIFYSQWLPESVFVQAAAHALGVKSAILGIGDDVIIWPHESQKKLEIFKNLIQNADLRITNADYLGREINKITGVDRHYYVNYFGVDYDLFKPVIEEEKNRLKAKFNIPEGKIVILIIGSPIVRKGWLDLFDALVQIKKVNSNFILIGGYAGPKDIEILEEINKRGLTDNFYNQGEIKPNELNLFYNMSDIFCLPSHWEGLATVVMEAMSCGLPVITTNVCGHPEIISHNATGILIDPKRPDQIEAELLSLLQDETKRKQLGNAARSFIVNKWGNSNENAKKLLDILVTAL